VFNLDTGGDGETERGGRDIIGLEVHYVRGEVDICFEQYVLEGRAGLGVFDFLDRIPVREEASWIVGVGESLSVSLFIN